MEKVLYKLHKRILARHSKMFENMLALPGHGRSVDPDVGNIVSDTRGDQDVTTDVPVVTMTEEVMELDTLVNVLYDPLSL